MNMETHPYHNPDMVDTSDSDTPEEVETYTDDTEMFALDSCENEHLQIEITNLPDGALGLVRFQTKRGSEIGYHCHLYETKTKKDTGLLITVKGDEPHDVYSESHRSGTVKNPISIMSIGKKTLELIGNSAIDDIGKFPSESRRKPSKKADKFFSTFTQ